MTAEPPESPRAHRPNPPGVRGPRLRTDIVDVYVFRRPAPATNPVEFLQLLRESDPLARTWQPVMGHVEAGEAATDAALRELREEVGLVVPSPACLGLWALEQVHPFYIAAIDTIVMSPRFACEVSPTWTPTLNDEHLDWRWVSDPSVFLWPGQKRCLEAVLSDIVPQHSLSRERLRIR